MRPAPAPHLLLWLTVAGLAAASDKTWKDDSATEDKKPSVFSHGENEVLIDTSVRQPLLVSKTLEQALQIGGMSGVHSSSLASLSDITGTIQENGLQSVEKRHAEIENFDKKYHGINVDTVSIVDNNLDVPTPLASNQVGTTSLHRDRADKDFYEQIQPTKSEDIVFNQDSFSKTGENKYHQNGAGEAMRASARGRALSLPKPRSASDLNVRALNSTSQNSTLRSDKPSPDIHDIITGFVKLLNGNVQVQVNPNLHSINGRPLFPVRTRINNRGPPRITDIPPLDLDPPAPPRFPAGSKPHPVTKLKIPPPYPFDIPPPVSSLPPQPTSVLRPFISGIPLPEQIVPSITNDKVEPSLIYIPSGDFNKSVIVPSKTKLNPFTSHFYQTNQESSSHTEDERIKEHSKKTELYKPTTHIDPTNTSSFTFKPTSTSLQNKQSFQNQNLQLNKSTIDSITEPVTVDSNKLDVMGLTIPSTEPVTTPVPTEKTTTTERSSRNETTQLTTALSASTKPYVQNVPSNTSVVSTPLIESSMADVSTPNPPKLYSWNDSNSTSKTTPLPAIPESTTNKYFPRPGIVLDDPEYKPGGGSIAYRPIVTAPPRQTSTGGGEIFDITVSAIQGPGASNTGQPFVYPVDIEGVQVGGGSGEVSVITSAEAGQHYVSIDGKRTYINLFNTAPPSVPEQVAATPSKPVIKPTAYTVGQVSSDNPLVSTNKRPSFQRRPTHPPVRIDTCIVGDDSTCDKAQNERCLTEVGVSSCHCKPGYSRRKHREPCIRIVSIVMSLRVDRMYDQRLSWSDRLRDKNSPEYLQLEYESSSAIDSAMQMTPFSDEFLGCRINSLYTVPGGGQSPVFVNLTLQLEESAETLRPAIKKEIQRHLVGVIQRRSNNVGSSAIWVDSPAGSVSNLQDLNECQLPELHDCHMVATCTNTFGSFQCTCPDGYRDPWAGNAHHSGRECHTCQPDYCNNRGECRYQNDQPICKCAGSYGAQCEMDGEVLVVAIGASVAAVVIIVSTLVCLCMWSRRWNREQKVAAGMGSPVFGYMATAHNNTIKSPVNGTLPYQVSLEDRLRWAQIADVMAQATNHYAPEPSGVMSRPATTIFGYGGTLPHLSAPIPMPRLSLRPASVHGTRAGDSSCSEEEDRTDLLGRNFHVPRPKSRSSIANQSGIYYDVDYEPQPVPGCIPMNTYTMSNCSNYYRT